MNEAKLTWSLWQALLRAFAWAFTRRGFPRFAEWITAMALNVEEHTITQSVLALEPPAACPTRASTVRAHNWGVCGALLHEPAKPAWFLPIAGWLYFRQSQLPSG